MYPVDFNKSVPASFGVNAHRKAISQSSSKFRYFPNFSDFRIPTSHFKSFRLPHSLDFLRDLFTHQSPRSENQNDNQDGKCHHIFIGRREKGNCQGFGQSE